MRASVRFLSPLIIAVVLSFSLGAIGVAKQPVKYRDDTILVKPKKGVALEQLEHVHKQLGVRVQHTLKGIGNLQIVKLPPGLSVEKAIARYEKSGQVAYAEPDYEVHAVSVGTNENCQALSTPSDPYFQDGMLWGLHNYGQNGGTCGADIDAPEAWQMRTDAGNVVVAVIDTGIRYTHEDLAANMWTNPGEIPGNGIDDDSNGIVDDVYGARFINGVVTGDPWDDHFHGTHVSGTIMGRGDNGKGVVGVAWSGKVMAIKFLNASGQGYNSDAVLAIDYARQMGAKVMNNSWGGGAFSQAMLDAIIAARNANMIFVAAAGNNSNDNDSNPFYPAGYTSYSSNVVAIAATDRNDLLAGFSNYGANTVQLGAPGVDVFSCYNSSDSAYAYLSGTSMATPHVTGACALLWAQYPSASYSEIIQRVLRGVDYIDSLRDLTITGGRLNLHRSLEDPVADFDAAISDYGTSLYVTVTDRSLAWNSAIVSRQFDLGDGTVTNASVVTHTYSGTGPFYAVLRVENSAGTYSTKVRKISRPVDPLANMELLTREDCWVEGPYGGPFGDLKEYDVRNIGPTEVDVAVTSTVDWMYVNWPEFHIDYLGEIVAVYVGAGPAANTMPPGIYGGPLDFINTINGRGNARQWIQLTVKAPGALVVTPDEPFESAGLQGGPFTPATKVYTVQNISTNFTLDFSAVGNADWHTVQPESGTLGPGQSAQVTVSINAGATSLPAGVYTETIGFNNETTGEYLGDRTNTLTVSSLLNVTPTGNFVSSGPVGGPFTPNSITYTLQWLGATPVNWSAAPVDDWLSVSPESGTLNPNETVQVTLSYNSDANSLPEGIWDSGVSFWADQFNTFVNLFSELIVGQGQLFVTPYQNFTASGPQGGPFSPASKTYHLQWFGVTNVQWAVNLGAGWLAASPASGVLTNGESIDVTVSVVNASSLTPGSYQSTIAFVNAERSLTYATFQANLTVTPAGTLTVDPADPTVITGPDGGPFSNKWYYLYNNTPYPLNWAVSASQPWISFSGTSGTLPAGWSTHTIVTFNNSAANSLPPGNYSGQVTIENTSNGSGTTTRDVSLTVVPAGVLSVSPSDAFTSSGPQGGPFTPDSKTYTLQNTGGWPITFAVNQTFTWIWLTPNYGTLAPGASTNLVLTVHGGTLTAGTYSNAVTISNLTNGRGNTSRSCILTVGNPAGVLSVTPAGGLSSSGYQGGPFSPSSQAYTLQNTGGQSINWSASKSAAWVSLSAASGTLTAGGSVNVTVSINSGANSLAAGNYSDTVSFNNTSNGNGNTTRAVSLTVTAVILNAPTSLVATQITSTSVRLDWTDTSTNEEGFAIERAQKTGNNWGNYSQIGTAGANATTYTDSGVSKKSYRYRVRSYRGANYGPYSNVAEITVK
jgi:subtilisin family serine protease